MTKHEQETEIVSHLWKEGEAMEQLAEINANTHGCMDGRKIALKLQKKGNIWQIVVSADSAPEVVEAHLPGGALGFIAVLEKIAHVPREKAVVVVEQALKQLGMEPQFHIDNHHGEVDVEAMSGEEVVEFIKEYLKGCGFAARIWGDEAANKLLRELADRGWVVEILKDHHEEEKAIKIEKEGLGLNTSQSTHAFTFNSSETQYVLEAIAEIAGLDNDFVQRSMEWFESEFAAIANALSEGRITSVETMQ